MKKKLYEEPSSEEVHFEYEPILQNATGDPWIVIDETNGYDEEDFDHAE